MSADPESLILDADRAAYEAKRNGFDYQASGISVTVNSPPASGPNTGTTGAVEVIITKSQSFSLGAVLVNWLGGSSSSFTMRARSVAAANHADGRRAVQVLRDSHRPVEHCVACRSVAFCHRADLVAGHAIATKIMAGTTVQPTSTQKCSWKFAALCPTDLRCA